MPTLEIPPNPAPPTPTPERPPKVATRRFGELEEHELIYLLDSIDDEISRARFRESIYVSVILCLALAWFAFYGPRVLFHEGRIANPKANVAEKKELPFIDLPKSLVKTPKVAKNLSDQNRVAQTPKPVAKPQPPAARPGAPGAQAAQRQLPNAPQPQPQRPSPPQQAQQQQPPAPQPQQQQPRPTQNAAIPDAPKPSSNSSSRPNFGTPTSPGQSNRDAASAAVRGSGGNYGSGPSRQSGVEGAEILSDTLGVDFWPYIKRLLRILYDSWLPLIPEETRPPLNKEGTTQISFTINPDGSLAAHGMRLDSTSHDVAIDRAAWGSITGVGQFPPLPKEFKGPNLQLRIHFVITHNPVKNDF